MQREVRPDHLGWLLYAFGKFGLPEIALARRAGQCEVKGPLDAPAGRDRSAVSHGHGQAASMQCIFPITMPFRDASLRIRTFRGLKKRGSGNRESLHGRVCVLRG